MIEEPGSSGPSARLRALALHHRIATVAELERVALTAPAAEALCGRLLARGIPSVPLSTCHRTELYWESRDPADDARARELLGNSIPATLPGETPGFGALRGEPVIRHLYRVAAGLESALVGESEILGQVRSAVELATAAGVRSRALRELFRGALHFGGLARTRTRIGQGALSIASAAVQLLDGIRKDQPEGLVLIVGAGTIGQKILRHLNACRRDRLVLINRTLARAEAAARPRGAIAGPLTELPRWLVRADAVIVAAQSESRLLTADLVRSAGPGRRAQAEPLVIMDLSMPRAVDPEVAGIAGVVLKDLSSLEAIVGSNRIRREAEIPRVEALLEESLRQVRRRDERRLLWERGIRRQERTG